MEKSRNLWNSRKFQTKLFDKHISTATENEFFIEISRNFCSLSHTIFSRNQECFSPKLYEVPSFVCSYVTFSHSVFVRERASQMILREENKLLRLYTNFYVPTYGRLLMSL